MKDMKEAKKKYDEIEIPPELDKMVRDTIAFSETRIKKEMKEKTIDLNVYQNTQNGDNMKQNNSKLKKILKYTSRAAAILLVVTTIGLNASQTFAQDMGDIPVIGVVAKILTIRSYEKHEDNKNVTVEVPEVKVENGTTDKKFIGDVNTEIQKIVDDYVAEAEKNYEEYKKAFLETGGTEEEWKEHDIDINVGYEIKYEDDTKVSFVLTGWENWASYSQKQIYYNLDLINNKQITLEDVFGENYVEIANTSILGQMKERMEKDDVIYWGMNEEEVGIEEGFKTVDKNTAFYINKKGNPVVTFEKYSIGPGYMGVQEFEIVK